MTTAPSRMKRRHYTSFRDGYTLLFHRLMDTRPIRIVHLVKLIDTADTAVAQDECTTVINCYSMSFEEHILLRTSRVQAALNPGRV